MPLSFMNETVTVLRAPLKTVRGTKVRDWSSTTTVDGVTSRTLGNVLITAQATMQDRDGREIAVSDQRRLRAMYDADIQAGDRVVWNGETYEVDGEVFKTKSPTGRVSSTRCALARWRG